MALGIQRWEDKCHCPQEVQNIGMGGGGKICKLIGETSALELIFLFYLLIHMYICACIHIQMKQGLEYIPKVEVLL